MNQARPKPEQLRFDAIASRIAEGARDWSIVADTAGLHIVTGPANDFTIIATVSDEAPYADRELLLHAVDDLIWIMRLYRRVADAFRKVTGRGAKPGKPKDYAAQCAMLCEGLAFRQFLVARHRLDVSDAERVAVGVRTVLRIASRAELKTDPDAAERWLEMLGDFEAWKRSGR